VTASKAARKDGPGRGDGLAEVRWVERDAEVAAVAAEIGSGPLAVDTEADSFHRYREKTCLLQLSYRGNDVLVDTLSGADLTALDRIFRDRGVRKILHGADYDIRMLHRDCGLTVEGLFDTMIAARLVGERAYGLAALLEKYVGVKLDKRFQRADWSERPLPTEMVRYAVLDTRHLERLAGLLETRLEELGRGAWAGEEFRRLEAVRWGEERRAEDGWLRVKRTRELDRRQLAVVRALADLRELKAEARDVPLFRVLRDEVLVDLARAATEVGPEGASGVRGLPRSWRQGSRARDLREAIAAALLLEPEAWPVRPRQPRPPRPSAAEVARLRRAGHERDRIAESLGLEPALIAPRALLERMLAQQEANRPFEELPELRRWQLELLGPALEAARS